MEPKQCLLTALVSSLLTIFFVMFLGYAAKATEFINPEANKGIGPMVGKICLPLLIFRNVAKLDLSTVNIGVVGSCAIVKIVSFSLSWLLAKATTKKKSMPGDNYSQLGIMTLFCTGSNDLAIGLAIIKSLFPVETSPIDFGAITFVIVGMQVAIFNIPSFVYLELGKGIRAAAAKDKANCQICAKKLSTVVAMNLLQNPILVSTFLGLIYNFINPPNTGDMSPNKNIPLLIDKMLEKAGSAFGMSALFLGGMAVVGKGKLLQGKKLLFPIILSLIKVMVAPILGYYIAYSLFKGDVNRQIYSQYVFIYCSLPTAGSIIVFAQQYDVALKDMISGAAILVLVLWAPIMFLTASLLVGGSVSGSGLANLSHGLSTMSGLFLLLTAYISPEWMCHPKALVAQIALAAVVFGLAHTGCMSSVLGNASGGIASKDLYLLTYFGRLWLRMILGFVCPTDLFLLWTKGRTAASQYMPYTSGFGVAFALISTIVFTANISKAQDNVYACWYMFGDGQIEYGEVQYSLIILYSAFVLVWVKIKPPTCKAPMTTEDASDTHANTTTIENVLADENHTNNTKAKSSIGNYDADDDVSGKMDDSYGMDDSHEETKTGYLRPKKCGVTGGYVYRMELLVGINIFGNILAVLLSQSAMQDASMKPGMPIIDLLSLCNIFITDAAGFITFLIFHSMKKNGWIRFSQKFRQFKRSLHVLNLLKDEGAQEGASNVPIKWKRLANQLAASEVTSKATVGEYTFDRCVPGNTLLSYLVDEKIGQDRDGAKALCSELFHFDLLHHVTLEFGIDDLDSPALFTFVETDEEELAKVENGVSTPEVRFHAAPVRTVHEETGNHLMHAL